MHFSLREITLLRLLIPFIIGIISGEYFYHFNHITTICAVGAAAFILTHVLKSFIKIFVQNVLITFLFILAGALTVTNQGKSLEIKETLLSNPSISTIVIKNFAKSRSQYIIRGHLMSIDRTILDSKIPIELYSNDNAFQRLRPLDTLTTSIIIKKTQAPPHKYAFDYQSHLSYQGIQYQGWVQKIIQINSVDDYDGLGIIAYKLRSNLLEIIKTNYNSEISSILSALLIGYRNDIDPELQKQFANSGAIHVLAVSGLHVGIIVFLLKLLLFWLPEADRYVLLESIIIAAGLIFYALLTGLSTPVIRATVIFCLFLINRHINLHTNSINLLAAAAFIILLVDPLQLYHLGFQLSFAAVFGIILFYPLLYKKLYFSNKIMDYLWSLSAVSLAAQIFILPLSLFYFHQFPTFFLFSSIVSILCAFLIIAIGLPILLLCLSFPYVSESLMILEPLVLIIIKTTSFFDQLSSSTLRVIWFTPIHLGLIFISLIALTIYIRTKRMRWLNLSFAGLISFGLMCISNLIQQKNQFILSYYEQDEEFMDIIIGQNVYELSLKEISEHKKLFITENFRHAHNTKEVLSIESLEKLLKRQKDDLSGSK